MLIPQHVTTLLLFKTICLNYQIFDDTLILLTKNKKFEIFKIQNIKNITF